VGSTDPTVVHRWATPAFATPFSTPTTGARTGFSFVSRTLSGMSGEVTVCVRLHAMSKPATRLAAGSYTLTQWPTEPESVAFVLQDHAAFELAAGDRLVLTVSLTSTSQQDLELRYDHPDDRTFISVATTTPLS
jgi:ectoine hydroxylase-related dioxygenase (phytanoyl-CoA dioxygenase family)